MQVDIGPFPPDSCNGHQSSQMLNNSVQKPSDPFVAWMLSTKRVTFVLMAKAQSPTSKIANFESH